MKVNCFVITTMLLVQLVKTQEENDDCEVERTYYSPIVEDCVECPEGSIGCNTPFNKETLENCLKTCKKYFSTTVSPTTLELAVLRTTPELAARENNPEKTALQVGIAVPMVLVLLVLAGVMVRRFIGKRKRSCLDYDVEKDGTVKEGKKDAEKEEEEDEDKKENIGKKEEETMELIEARQKSQQESRAENNIVPANSFNLPRHTPITTESTPPSI